MPRDAASSPLTWITGFARRIDRDAWRCYRSGPFSPRHGFALTITGESTQRGNSDEAHLSAAQP